MQRDANSPAEWMRYAKSDLQLARTPKGDEVLLESLCFNAQQAVEKSVKAVLVSCGISFPKIHSIERLIDLLPADIPRPSDLISSARLSAYATVFRYPGVASVSEEKYREAVRLAESVVKWAEDILR